MILPVGALETKVITDLIKVNGCIKTGAGTKLVEPVKRTVYVLHTVSLRPRGKTQNCFLEQIRGTWSKVPVKKNSLHAVLFLLSSRKLDMFTFCKHKKAETKPNQKKLTKNILTPRYR